ncbi:hypothetical protein JCM10207_001416 [Rhodosporidiobolus poonsookiae]
MLRHEHKKDLKPLVADISKAALGPREEGQLWKLRVVKALNALSSRTIPLTLDELGRLAQELRNVPERVGVDHIPLKDLGNVTRLRYMHSRNTIVQPHAATSMFLKYALGVEETLRQEASLAEFAAQETLRQKLDTLRAQLPTLDDKLCDSILQELVLLKAELLVFSEHEALEIYHLFLQHKQHADARRDLDKIKAGITRCKPSRIPGDDGERHLTAFSTLVEAPVTLGAAKWDPIGWDVVDTALNSLEQALDAHGEQALSTVGPGSYLDMIQRAIHLANSRINSTSAQHSAHPLSSSHPESSRPAEAGSYRARTRSGSPHQPRRSTSPSMDSLGQLHHRQRRIYGVSQAEFAQQLAARGMRSF